MLVRQSGTHHIRGLPITRHVVSTARLKRCLCDLYWNRALIRSTTSRRFRRRIDAPGRPSNLTRSAKSMKRCLFAHKWLIQTETKRRVDGFEVRSVIPYRTCERCGKMERGIQDKFWRDIVWEPLRAGTDITLGKTRFFRQPVSPLAQLAHSLGLRRSRKSDEAGSEADKR